MGTYLDQTELYLFNEGKSAYAYRALGCHRVTMEDGGAAYRFAVWAPNALSVSVVGSFNNWDVNANIMEPCFTTGVWQAHIRNACAGDLYKFAIYTADEQLIFKADPFAFYSQMRPDTASVIWDNDSYAWHDEGYMRHRPYRGSTIHTSPVSIYGCISAPGGRGLITPRLPSSLRTTLRRWAIPMLSLCRLANIRLTTAGATKPRGITAPPPATATRTG